MGEKKDNFNKLLFLVVVLAVLVPSCISLIVAFQVKSLRKEVTQLHEEISAQGDADTYLKDSQVPLTQGELGAEDADLTENVDIMDNNEIWESIGKISKEWGGKPGIRKVYLTFDDGPSANTDRILDILDEYGVKATFFVVGKEGYKEEYQRIVKEGHTLGMHSYSHKYQEIYASVDSYKEDLDKLHSFLFEKTGVDCNIVRFPGGSSNTISEVDMRELISYLKDENITFYDWNVYAGDATGNYISAEDVAKNIIDSMSYYNTVIVLMHDSASRDTTVEALPMVIEKILEMDNTVILPISEDTVPVQHLHD